MDEDLLASSLRGDILAAIWRFEALTKARVTDIDLRPYAESHPNFPERMKEVVVRYVDRNEEKRSSPINERN
jgi:hypothetical protein